MKIDINEFSDCYRKIHLTMKALRDKDIECNLIGGTTLLTYSIYLIATWFS
jgi:hypothetical protein